MIPKELKEMHKTAYDWLELTNDIAIDYDGYRKPEGLMSLIDEMREYVIEAMKCIKEGKYD